MINEKRHTRRNRCAKYLMCMHNDTCLRNSSGNQLVGNVPKISIRIKNKNIHKILSAGELVPSNLKVNFLLTSSV